MRTINASLYDYPRYYDLVFGSDWKAEFDFLRGCFARYARLSTGEVRRVFEPACGTGRLLFRLGAAGLDVSGLDLNENAVKYCNRRLQRHGLPASCVVGDMTDFRLRRKVDAAFNTINSFRHLTEEQQAHDHLLCVANALRTGGLYILGFDLTPTRGKSLDEESWSARRGHLCVNTQLWSKQCDLRRRQQRFGMRCEVYTPTDSFCLEQEIAFRTYTAEQFRRLLEEVRLFEIAAVYDFAYELDSPIHIDVRTQDVVYVLRKTGERRAPKSDPRAGRPLPSAK